MATIAEQLTSLANTKTAIKDAIVAKGVQVADTDPFSAYPDKIGQISGGGGAPATKFGVSIDNLLGNVNADRVLSAPTEPFILDLSGVQAVNGNALGRVFGQSKLQEVIADDIVEVRGYGFSGAFQNAYSLLRASFNGLVEVSTSSAFSNSFQNATNAVVIFGNLKRVSGVDAFYYAFYGNKAFIPDVSFPVLEEITGRNAFSQGFDIPANKTVQFTALKKVTGGESSSYTTFSMYTSRQIWKFPNVTEITGYVFRDYVSEIHFAAANQAAIEACDGYSYKWGATSSTIYFDL